MRRLTIGFAMLLFVGACTKQTPRRTAKDETVVGNSESGVGTLTAEQLEEIQGVVRRGINTSLRRCYQKQLESHGRNFKAKMVLRILVGRTGKAAEVKVDGLEIPEMKACIATVVRSWEFPQLKAEASFTYPVSFEPAY